MTWKLFFDIFLAEKTLFFSSVFPIKGEMKKVLANFQKTLHKYKQSQQQINELLIRNNRISVVKKMPILPLAHA